MTSPRYSIESMLYDMLPDYYRNQDRVGLEGSDEDRPLQKYLGALGAVLDSARYTLEQQYKDAFAETCQDWMLPYLADLLGVELLSPYAQGQRVEISNAVRWSQSRGTLGAIEECVENLTQSEGALVEGWKRVVTSARINMPLLPALAMGDIEPRLPDVGALGGPVTPSKISRHPCLPQVTPRMSQHMRAVQTSMGTPTAQKWMGNQYSRIWPLDDTDPPVQGVSAAQPIYWRIYNPQGAPCLPDSYQDQSRRTPVISSSRQETQPYHPKLLGVYLPQLEGFTPTGALRFQWDPNLGSTSDDAPGTLADYITVHTQGDLTTYRNATAHSIIIVGNINLSGPGQVKFEKLAFENHITLTAGQASFERCAVNSIYSNVPHDGTNGQAPLMFKDCLIGQIKARDHSIQCEYVTVIGRVKANRILASDSIFSAIEGAGAGDCLRYCRVPKSYLGLMAPISRNATMTTASANFQTEPVASFNAWATRLDFSIIGLGTLTEADNDRLRFGAEDGGEMGAFHAFRYAAQADAVKRKLKDSLPVGITPVILRDPVLSCPPPILNLTLSE